MILFSVACSAPPTAPDPGAPDVDAYARAYAGCVGTVTVRQKGVPDEVRVTTYDERGDAVHVAADDYELVQEYDDAHHQVSRVYLADYTVTTTQAWDGDQRVQRDVRSTNPDNPRQDTEQTETWDYDGRLVVGYTRRWDGDTVDTLDWQWTAAGDGWRGEGAGQADGDDYSTEATANADGFLTAGTWLLPDYRSDFAEVPPNALGVVVHAEGAVDGGDWWYRYSADTEVDELLRADVVEWHDEWDTGEAIDRTEIATYDCP